MKPTRTLPPAERAAAIPRLRRAAALALPALALPALAAAALATAAGAGGTDTLGNEIKYVRCRVYRSAYRYPQNSASGSYEHDLVGFRLCIPEDPE